MYLLAVCVFALLAEWHSFDAPHSHAFIIMYFWTYTLSLTFAHHCSEIEDQEVLDSFSTLTERVRSVCR
jgi:hypothetical protein